uniref:Uncharacterized protein n=1 Tax=Romanomermis culicivorax TaxID=13658 RepID=A0A915HZS5_ROMCU
MQLLKHGGLNSMLSPGSRLEDARVAWEHATISDATAVVAAARDTEGAAKTISVRVRGRGRTFVLVMKEYKSIFLFLF